ncbi:sigma-70 family RNA polymerase sigma factor (plasmid) [Streptomyces sp. HUAS MG91]|uniref:Sigma-70 family RNA polymerase sigma factor n=1 Tax=Streptomyces tabacisoli TaxID=3156398 RepID=A0AAU8J674_9ACTN
MNDNSCVLHAEFAAFTETTCNGLYWHAFRLCKHHALAEDLVQSASVKQWKQWPRNRSRSFQHNRASAYRTVTNLYFDHLRGKSNSYTFCDIDDHDVAADAEMMDAELIAAENAREVLQAVDQLPDPLGDLIRAVYLDEMTVAAFANQKGLAPKTASRYHLKALKLLHTILEKRS